MGGEDSRETEMWDKVKKRKKKERERKRET